VPAHKFEYGMLVLSNTSRKRFSFIIELLINPKTIIVFGKPVISNVDE
jgi:hypothetical protein